MVKKRKFRFVSVEQDCFGNKWGFCGLFSWRNVPSIILPVTQSGIFKIRNFRLVGTRFFRKLMFPQLLKGVTDISDKIFPLQEFVLFSSNVTNDMNFSLN